MMLFRICYITKSGFPRGVTIGVPSQESAARFADWWEKAVGVPVLTIKQLPQSKFGSGRAQLELV